MSSETNGDLYYCELCDIEVKLRHKDVHLSSIEHADSADNQTSLQEITDDTGTSDMKSEDIERIETRRRCREAMEDITKIKRKIKEPYKKICSELGIEINNKWTIRNMSNKIYDHLNEFDSSDNKKPKIKILDLCSGCGGIALGFRNDGNYTSVGLIEINGDCCDTLRSNGFDKVECADITKVDFKQDKYRCDIIVIGSPCQSFSYAGLKKGFNDTRGMILYEFIKILDILNPPMFLIENVEGLMTHDKGSSMKNLLKVLGRRYHVKYQLLDSSLYSVPQKRKRIFIFGSRYSDGYEFPIPDKKIVTLGDAIRDIEDDTKNIITNKYKDDKLKYFKKIPQGGCWINLNIEDQKTYLGKSYNSGGGKRGILRRLSYDKPCLTILCSPQQKQTERCHPTKDRPLTLLESARVQTFPDNYIFAGSISSRYKQIGNAVPVLLAQAVAKSIYIYWAKNKHLSVPVHNTVGDEGEDNDENGNIDDGDGNDGKNTNSGNNNDDNKSNKETNGNNSDIEAHKYVPYMDDDTFADLVDKVLLAYNVDKKVDISKNMIDPIKMIFDMSAWQITEEEWRKNEADRQLDKTVNNAIGYFHQRFLSNIKGWIDLDCNADLKSLYGVDLCNEEKTIFIEIKNKYNTMNSSCKRDVINRLNLIKKLHPEADVYIGIIISKVESKVVNGIKYVNGKELYKIVTGDEGALELTLSALYKYLKNTKKIPGENEFWKECVSKSFNINLV